MRKENAWIMAMIFAGGMIACSAKRSHVSAQHPTATSPTSPMAADNDLLRAHGSTTLTQDGMGQDGDSVHAAGNGSASEANTSVAAAGSENENGSFSDALGSSSQVISKSIVPRQCGENSLRCHVVQMMEVQREAHIIFNQAWAAIWKDNGSNSNSEVGSVFKSTLLDLKQMYRADGASVTPTLDCPSTKPVLENLSRGKDTRYVLTLTDCHSNRSWERVTFEKKAALQWQMTYVTRNFPASAQGKEMQLLGQPVVCQAQLDQSMRLAQLNCKGLGQNHQADEFAELTQFSFSKTDQSYLLQIKGIKYRGIQNKTGDFDVLVPVAGPILYTEKVIVKKSKEAAPVSAPTPAVAPLENATPASNKAVDAATSLANVNAGQQVQQSGRPVGRQQVSQTNQTEELLQMLTPEDRRQYDLMRPEEQQQALQELRWEKSQLDQQKQQQDGASAEVDGQEQQQGPSPQSEQNETSSMSVR